MIVLLLLSASPAYGFLLTFANFAITAFRGDARENKEEIHVRTTSVSDEGIRSFAFFVSRQRR